MSNSTPSCCTTTTNKLMGAMLTGLVLLAVIIGALVCRTFQPPKPIHATSARAVADRIKPVGEVVVATADTAAAPDTAKSGEQIVSQTCSACHGTGVMGSPKLGDKAAWEPRIAQGYETLLKHAVAGIRSMPARGGNPALSDEEIAAAVVHMANGAGASFKTPSK